MYLFSIFTVVALIAVAGEAVSLVENPWDTPSDLLASSSRDSLLSAHDVTDDAGVNSVPEMMGADVPCSLSPNNQGRKIQSSKVRRGQACPLNRSWDKTTSPNAQGQQEQNQGQQPHQNSNPDNTDNNAGTNNADSLVFSDDYEICNSILVGLDRQVPVCDSGRAQDRSIFRGRIDQVQNIMASGTYTLLDVTPVPLLYGCFGSSITWCCEFVEKWHTPNFLQKVRLVGINCVAINGLGINPAQTGPIQP